MVLLYCATLGVFFHCYLPLHQQVMFPSQQVLHSVWELRWTEPLLLFPPVSFALVLVRCLAYPLVPPAIELDVLVSLTCSAQLMLQRSWRGHL